MLDRVGRVPRDQLSRRRVARERDERDRRMAHERVADRLAVAGHDLEHARREDLLGELDEAEHRQRRLLGGLDDLDIARGERRAHLPDRHEEWVVPRADARHDPERLAPNERRVALDVLRRRLALEVPRRAGEEAEVVRHDPGLVARPQGLPTFADSSRANSSPCSSMRSASARSSSMRSFGVLKRHSSHAFCAASTARPTSSAVPRGTSAITSPVRG